MTEFISDYEIYEKVIQSALPKAKRSLWIATADIKDMHVKKGRKYHPFLAVLNQLIEDGVSVRLLHAKEPGKNFREDFDRYPALIKGLERMLCPRVHLKTIIIDQKKAYLGSANLTGAGLGAKHADRRNFESGILTTQRELILPIEKQFDQIWMGAKCVNCQRKKYCADPIG